MNRRRELLQGLAALAASGWMPPVVAQGGSLSAAQFANLSKTMTSFAYGDAALASSSAFPTITASPPTLTIAAFALRAALTIRTELVA